MTSPDLGALGRAALPIVAIDQVRAWLSRLTTQSVPAERAASLRIAVGGVWVFELLQLRDWQQDLYDVAVPGQSTLFDVWILATIAILVGLRPRLAAVVSFACFLVFFTFGTVIYHVDLVAQIATFYLVIIDSSRVWSLDAFMRRHGSTRETRVVWGLPVLALLLHTSSIYLDAGLSHLVFNSTWAMGDAVANAWGHPQWSTNFAGEFLAVPLLGVAATYATLIFELMFWVIAVVVAGDLVRHGRLSTLAFLSVLLFQVGIILTLDIGMFSPFMIAVAVPYLPWERIRRHPVSQEPAILDSTPRKFVVAGLVVLVAVSFAATPPTLVATSSIFGPRGPSQMLVAALASVGDQRPHNVFSDPVIGIIVSAQVIDSQGNEQFILFGPRGQRIGDMVYVRAYMSVERMLRPGTATSAVAFRTLLPALQRAAHRGELGPGAYAVRESSRPAANPTGVGGSTRHLFSFAVTPDGNVVSDAEMP